MAQSMDSRMDQYWENNLETLSKWLGLLKITEEEASSRTTEIETIEEMSTALVPAIQNKQAVMPKSMVLDSEWFNGDRIKFKDWWREICLFLKSNRVTATNDRITTILAYIMSEKSR